MVCGVVLCGRVWSGVVGYGLVWDGMACGAVWCLR